MGLSDGGVKRDEWIINERKRERRQIIHKLEFAFYVFEIKKECFKGQKSVLP